MSDRRRLVEGGHGMRARICTSPAVAAPAAATVVEATRAMRTKNVGTVVVVDARRPIGLLADREIGVEVAQGKDPETLQVGNEMGRISAARASGLRRAS